MKKTQQLFCLLAGLLSSGLAFADFADVQVRTFTTSDNVQMQYNWEPSLGIEGESAPILLMVHGGTWTGGSKDDAYFYTRHADAEYILRQYFNVVSVDYRLFNPWLTWINPWPTQLNDVADLVNYLKAQDPDRNISVLGASAGAQIAMATAVHYPDQIQCAAGVAGPYEFDAAVVDATMNLWQQFSANQLRNSNTWQYDPGPIENIPSNYSVPTLLMHSPGDWVVGQLQSDLFYNEMSDTTRYPLAQVTYKDIDFTTHIPPSLFTDPAKPELDQHTVDILAFFLFAGCLN